MRNMNIEELNLIIEAIADAAKGNHDVSAFGREVAEILKQNKIVDKAVVEVLLGE